MLGLLVAYAWYYVCRYSLTYVGPELVRSQGLDMRDVGFLTSVCQITIGLSKLGGSILTADMSPSVTLALGLVLAALCNLAAAAVPAGSPAALVPALGVIWALNGLWQGFGSPACARIIDAWCRPEERGTFWSVWNTSNNIGGALAPIIAGAGVAWAGWRGGLLLAGASALGAAGLVLLLARDAPGGAPAGPRGARRGRRAAPGTVRLLLLAQGRGARAGPGAGGQLASPGSSAGRWSLLWAGCLRQPGIVRLACANFLIYGIRGAVVSWLAFFMLHTGRGLASAAALLSTFEVGGLFGSFLGGVVSDLRLRGRAAAPVVGLRVDTSLLSRPAAAGHPGEPAMAEDAEAFPSQYDENGDSSWDKVEKDLRGAELRLTCRMPDGKEHKITCNLGHDVAYAKGLLCKMISAEYGDVSFFLDGKLMFDPLSFNDFPALVKNQDVTVEVQLKGA